MFIYQQRKCKGIQFDNTYKNIGTFWPFKSEIYRTINFLWKIKGKKLKFLISFVFLIVWVKILNVIKNKLIEIEFFVDTGQHVVAIFLTLKLYEMKL